MRFWMSWYETSEDYRPVTFPPNEHILGWWCTGVRLEDEASTICAWVEANDEEEAKDYIYEDWPGEHEYRFTEQVDGDWVPGDRFPLSPWMEERI